MLGEGNGLQFCATKRGQTPAVSVNCDVGVVVVVVEGNTSPRSGCERHGGDYCVLQQMKWIEEGWGLHLFEIHTVMGIYRAEVLQIQQQSKKEVLLASWDDMWKCWLRERDAAQRLSGVINSLAQISLCWDQERRILWCRENISIYFKIYFKIFLFCKVLASAGELCEYP